MEILALGVLLAAFTLGLLLGQPYIRLLRHFHVGQNIRPEGPSSHYGKQGTPTMGGALVIVVVAGIWALLLLILPDEERGLFVPQSIVPIGSLIAVGILGAIDDLINVRYGFGIRGRHKLVWQFFVAVTAAIYIQRHFAVTAVFVPFLGQWEVGSIAIVLLAIFVIIGTSNAVNLTDGMDG
jgi:phospho-N-acetylmuramoyl-pentapeptide-transferase